MRGSFLLLGVMACARDPVDAICPDVDEGALVVSEVRGPQSPEDTNGPWVELYNATGASIDLEGTKVRFRRKDGSSEIPVLVRRSLPVAAGDYVVLGLFSDIDRPAHVDYGFLDDFSGSWLAAAAIQIDTCGERVDVAVYDVLPDTGTFSLGTDPPDSTSNDLAASWCTDAMSAGTPGAANTVCP